MMENKDFNIELTDRQAKAWELADDPTVTDIMYGGAKGGGKSVFACVFAYSQCRQIIEKFNLKQSKNPIHVGWMGRKQAVDFKGTTLDTWRRIIPESHYEIKGGTEKDPAHILIFGRVAIDFGGLDRQENINKFNSAEYAFIVLDQAEEATKDEVSVLRASRRLKINGQSLNYKALFTANPAKCWLKDEFLTSPKPNYRFIQALPSDNPHLPDSYVQMLKDAFSHRPELLKAYLDGSWEIADDAAQIIKSQWLQKAFMLQKLHFMEIKRRLLSCDVARYGDDETVIYDMEETDILAEEIYGQKDTMFTANMLCKMSMDRDDCPIVVDEIGVGGGIVDRLIELQRIVIPICSSEKAENPKYYNRRAEIWDNASMMAAEGDIELHWDDDTLKAQLTTPTYQFRNGKILVEAKDDIKKRLGRSPDRADTYVNGLWGLRLVSPKITARPRRSEKKLSFVSLGIG